MLEHLKNEANRARTENGAVAYATTLSDCLDLFATIGALRSATATEIIIRFERAYAEDANLAMKILFYARDVRSGLGERRAFRAIWRHLGDVHPDSAHRNIALVAEYGRYDDLLSLLDTRCEADAIEYLRLRFEADMAELKTDGEVSLLGKWLPSVNASNGDAVRAAKRLARAFGLREQEYRRALSMLRKRLDLLENRLRVRDYTFDYQAQPSKAMLRYRKAFSRNDGERYRSFLSLVVNGKAKLNAATLMPYEIIAPALNARVSGDERRSLDAAWRALPDFTGGERALAVVDGSGSMYFEFCKPLPILVAVSLGMYFAERNTGAFKDHFITFSESPQLVELKGADIVDRTRYVMSFNEAGNTNLEKVFELILKTAVRHRLSQDDLPSALYILSDMEFDACVIDRDRTNLECARELFERAGYRLPRVVFWNVASRNRQQPVTMNESGVTLVSGACAQVFQQLREGAPTPMSLMMAVLGAERYARIAA